MGHPCIIASPMSKGHGPPCCHRLRRSQRTRATRSCFLSRRVRRGGPAAVVRLHHPILIGTNRPFPHEWAKVCNSLPYNNLQCPRILAASFASRSAPCPHYSRAMGANTHPIRTEHRRESGGTGDDCYNSGHPGRFSSSAGEDLVVGVFHLPGALLGWRQTASRFLALPPHPAFSTSTRASTYLTRVPAFTARLLFPF